jgi:hypothetical protein
MPVCTQTHAHTHAHTYINEVPVCSYPFILKHVHARTHSRTHARMPARTHTRTHAYTHTCTQALTHKASYAVYCTSCPVYLSNVFGATASLLVYLYYLLFWWHFECVYTQIKKINIFIFFLFKLNYNRSVHNYNICHIKKKKILTRVGFEPTLTLVHWNLSPTP